MQTKKEPLINMFDKDKISGIYKITNKHTGMSYIGRSINLNRRKQEHIRELFSS
ncbi:GIY-YIG nuclease family protein, partial [Clostridium perfringens]|uniref:GIY-YIG nuclease family protein n=1 Tax=Clostridium perfringens TaxID=1502 RepID=UPI0013EF75ED|nr:GIY-YIG nuclease family protein [Clostridium perfringens]